YNSLQNFSRVFKRYEGITPTNYRIPHRAAGSNSL
ncbi:MAG TPA: AraC family transcriptional regulator, partial [Clostridiales bacterium]|nr:AraC family transcriptional regulator [Clostridiales bacterium]